MTRLRLRQPPGEIILEVRPSDPSSASENVTSAQKFETEDDLPEELREELPEKLVLAFAPLHKRALGMAFGLAAGLLVFGATVVYLLRDPGASVGEFSLWLLANYFYGYTVSWTGALVGFAWAFVAGFVFGWFLAFVRNLVIAVSIFLIRARAELRETRDFLDHI